MKISKYAVLILLSFFMGLSLFTFFYAKGAAYFTNDPKACANCHAMESYYSGWMKGSHRSAAACNDCHAPKGFLSKYYVKAKNGFWHSYAFTLNNYADNLRITESNREVTLGTCKNCHSEIIESISGQKSHYQSDCLHCHGAVGHPKN